MKEQHDAGRKGHFIWIPVGMGKTYIVLSYLKYLKESNQLPPQVIYTLPSSAIKSIINELEAFNFTINLIVPLKHIVSNPFKGYIKHPGTCVIVPYMINLIEHDHMRKCEEQLSQAAPNSIVIIDEVHKALNDTKRTAVALQTCRLSEEFIALTGTPIIDTNTYKLIWWLEQIVPFSVNEKNFWVAANGMIAKKVNTGVKVDRKEIEAEFTKPEKESYMDLVPATIGGRNPNPSQNSVHKAMVLCYKAATRKMVDITLSYLQENKGVMVVAHTADHQEELYNLILKRSSLSASDIFLIKGSDSIFLTDMAVEKNKVNDYKVVITTIRKCEGYTLTRLKAMVTSVYPSNNASREQIEGRINRIGQKAKVIYIRTVHIGILTYIMQKHKDARNLQAVLQALCDEIILK